MDAVFIKSSPPSNRELVHAWEYTDDNEVNIDNFCCPHEVCLINQRLVSHLRKEKIQKKQSKNDLSGIKGGYFRVPKNSLKHHKDCPESNENKQGRKTKNGIDTSIPYEHISKIVLRESSTDNNEKLNRGHHPRTGEMHHNLKYHISNAVLWYLQNPKEGHQNLEIKGCNYKKYSDVFQRVVQNPSRLYTGKHIYFGALKQVHSENFVIKNGSAFFEIYQYQSEPISVELKLEGMSDYKIQFIEKIYKYAERNRLHRSSGNKDNLKNWIFFFGEPAYPGARSFIVDRHDCIFFHSTGKIDLNTNIHDYIEPEVSLELAEESSIHVDENASLSTHQYQEDFEPKTVAKPKQITRSDYTQLRDEPHFDHPNKKGIVASIIRFIFGE